jgi:exodeoxyribonuclease VII large subunit
VSPRRRTTEPAPEALDLFAAEPSVAPAIEPPRRGSSASRRAAAARPVESYDPYETVDVDDYSGVVPGASPASAVAVSTLTLTAKEVVEGAFMPLWVRGEISDFKAHRNGHWYFCLRDETAQIRCVIWSRDARRLPAAPDDGMQVVALGQPSIYAARGDLQLVVRALDAKGDGLWRKALERTRARLDADGLLDPARKRPLPRFPRRVAVITSPDGAALHDIVAVVRRRCPSVELVVVPAKVQGEGAAEELREAVERVSRWGEADVVVIGRGGGAREDLWAFNDEDLARAIAACPVPVISAVGHEVDVTICDLVADVRAATPSVAAETAVPLWTDMAALLGAFRAALSTAAQRAAERARERLDDTRAELVRVSERTVERRRARVETIAGRLHALSPLATLARGYAVARGADGRTLSRAADLRAAGEFDLLVSDGAVRARTV